ncbi:MAG: signal peptidase II [Dehalococcoidia bacterium]|nr:signal peptidase II [Dehalococcoidia bacterium]
MEQTLRPDSARRIESRRLAPFFGVSALVVLCDQLTKSFIRSRLVEGEAWPVLGSLLSISHVENSGAAFGILQGAGVFLLLTTVIGVAALCAYLFCVPMGSRWYTLSLALILGGAVGNFIDRVTRGTVTDFIDPTHYPAFNIADSAIVVGVGVLILATYLLPEEPAAGASGAES